MSCFFSKSTVFVSCLSAVDVVTQFAHRKASELIVVIAASNFFEKTESEKKRLFVDKRLTVYCRAVHAFMNRNVTMHYQKKIIVFTTLMGLEPLILVP